MRFTVLVAADLYNNKVNLELSFGAHPTLSELFRVVETTFAVESSAMRPAGQPFVPFKVSRFHVFDDRSQQWAELLNQSQLSDYCQVYAFQRDVAETQKQIPSARLPSAARIPSVANSPSRAANRANSPATPHGRLLEPSNGSVGRLVVGMNDSATPSGRHFPDNATHDQKTRIVFDEMDVNQNRVIELDEFRRSMRILNVDLNAATIADLFQRADTDRDGVLTMAEFQGLASSYPTLLDSLYFRSKEFWEDHKKKAAIEARKTAVEESRSKEHQAAQLAAESKAELAEQEHRVHTQEAELQQKLLSERDARGLATESKKEVERAQFERSEREREAVHGKEREIRRQSQLNESQRDTESAERRVQGQEMELARAQEKEKQLETLLADARRETERQARALAVLGDELQQVREREQQAQRFVAEAALELRRLQEEVALSDVDLGKRLQKDREIDGALSEAQRESARVAHRRDEEDKALQLQREREAMFQRQHQETTRGVEDAERALAQAEADYADYVKHRATVEQQELPLIEQEIRLREQRYNLEQMEARLKNEAASFQSATGRSAMRLDSARVSPPRR